MKTLRIAMVTLALLGLGAMSLSAKDKVKNPGKDKPEKTQAAKPAGSSKESWVDVKITTEERQVIETYVKGFSGKKAKNLPPGLQKKVARGGNLPPGWQKKLARGEVMSAEVFKVCTPLPAEVVVKLPPPPKGVITVTIEGKVVRLLEATREILDVFEVGR
ncbi:MAG: hypothetical protein AB1705_22820 [Verrucomicrobiota bacterium]